MRASNQSGARHSPSRTMLIFSFDARFLGAEVCSIIPWPIRHWHLGTSLPLPAPNLAFPKFVFNSTTASTGPHSTLDNGGSGAQLHRPLADLIHSLGLPTPAAMAGRPLSHRAATPARPVVEMRDQECQTDQAAGWGARGILGWECSTPIYHNYKLPISGLFNSKGFEFGHWQLGFPPMGSCPPSSCHANLAP